MAEIYRQRISALHESLQSDETKAEAAEIVRALVDQVTLVPEDGRLAIVLRGDLAGMLRFAAGKKKPDVLSEVGLIGDMLSPTSVVAGTRNTRFLRLVENVIPKLAA
jgi:site-specific DNA recombinase